MPVTESNFPHAVLWDMDGTLVDTEPYWIDAEFDIVEMHGGTWSHDHAKALVGSDLLDSGAYIREHGGVDRSPAEIVEMLLDRVVARVRAEVPWRPGARELLGAVRGAGVDTALVTMSWKRFSDEVVNCLPSGSFTVSVTGDEVVRGKPHPEPYLLAAERLGVRADQCVAIEDSPTGVRSALAAGCRVIGVPHVVDIPADVADLPESVGYLTLLPTLDGLQLGDLVRIFQRMGEDPAPDHRR
jgi:HAD superfamily hydrolase (TIGR01509 family)